jgi:hypothetical protein
MILRRVKVDGGIFTQVRSNQARMGMGIYGLLKVSLGPAKPNPSTPCGRATPKWPYGRLLPPWIPLPVRAWIQLMNQNEGNRKNDDDDTIYHYKLKDVVFIIKI